MEKSAVQRWIFAFLSFIVMLFVITYEPTVYGNDPASIERYIMKNAGLRMGDHVELLAVEDHGDDRIVIFHRETKRPDDVMIVRFRKNNEGNYETYGSNSLLGMHQERPGSRVWSDTLRGRGNDRQVLYVVWSESQKLAQIDALFAVGAAQTEQTVSITTVPSLTILEFEAGMDGFALNTAYYDAQGNELF